MTIQKKDNVMILNEPMQYQVFQRDEDNKSMVRVNGNCAGAFTSVRVRVIRTGSKEIVQDWSVVDHNPANGHFDGRLLLPGGGWYNVEVQAINGDDVVASKVVDKVGVGEVFAVAGQSNAANAGGYKYAAEEDFAVAFGLGSWGPARDPMPGADGVAGSPWPLMADMLSRSLKMPVSIASVAVGGTTVAEWMPGSGRCYPLLRDTVRVMGPNGIRAVLWHQGESEYYSNTSSETYYNSIKVIVKTLSSDAGYEVPWFVAHVGYSGPPPVPIYTPVIESQKRLWKDGIAFEGPDTDDIVGGTDYRPDGVHLGKIALRIHAERWYSLLWAQLFAVEPLKINQEKKIRPSLSVKR